MALNLWNKEPAATVSDGINSFQDADMVSGWFCFACENLSTHPQRD